MESVRRQRPPQRRKKSRRMRVSGSVECYVRGEDSLPSRRNLDSRSDEKQAGNYSHASEITSPVRDNKRSRWRDWQANVLGGRKPKNSGVAARRIIPNEPGTISDALVDALPAYMYAVAEFHFPSRWLASVGLFSYLVYHVDPPVHIRDVSVVLWRKFKISKKPRILSKTNDTQ